MLLRGKCLQARQLARGLAEEVSLHGLTLCFDLQIERRIDEGQERPSSGWIGGQMQPKDRHSSRASRRIGQLTSGQRVPVLCHCDCGFDLGAGRQTQGRLQPDQGVHSRVLQTQVGVQLPKTNGDTAPFDGLDQIVRRIRRKQHRCLFGAL